MTRPSGRAAQGERLLASAAHGHCRTTTFLAALRTAGLTGTLIAHGAINDKLGEVRPQLAPTLKLRDVAVMENPGVRMAAGVREAIAAARVRVSTCRRVVRISLRWSAYSRSSSGS